MNLTLSQTIAPTTAKYNFSPLSRITISDPEPRHYVQKARDANIIILTQVTAGDTPTPLSDAPTEIFSHADIGSLLQSKKIEIEPHFFDCARKQLIAQNADIDCAQDIPPEELEYLDFYKRLVDGVEKLRAQTESSLTDDALRPLISRVYWELVAQQAKPIATPETGGNANKLAKGQGSREGRSLPKLICPSTYRTYRKRLNKFQNDLLAIRDGRKTAATLRLPAIVDATVVEVMSRWVQAYLDRNEPTVPALYKQMLHEFEVLNADRLQNGKDELDVPSISTFRRRINKLRPYDVVLAREGAAAAHRQFKIAARHDTGLAPGDRVLMDNWRTNVGALKLPKHFWAGMPDEWRKKIAKTRLSLCLAIDEASRVILGVRLALNPTADVSIKTLEMTARDKTKIAQAAECASTWHHCLTALSVPTDGGAEFRKEFRAVVRDYGATSEVGPAGKPDVRAVVERAFGTIDGQLMQHFTGRTFKSVASKGDYDWEAATNVTVEVLTRCLVRYIVDVYHNQEHSSLGHETPNDAWIRLSDRYGVLPPPSDDQMRAVFGHRDVRVISNRGIRHLGLHYRSRELAVLRQSVGQQPLNIRVDLSNLGSISVQGLNKRWITVPIEMKDFDGVSAQEWIATAEALRRRYANNAKIRRPILLRALAAIRKDGLASAELAGIGPTLLSSEMVRDHETNLFASFDIEVATERGRALEGLDEDEPDDAAPDDQAPVAPADSADSAETVVKRSSPTGRRRGSGADFLGED
ncbi:Mu transposase C-terminal domain-containing protein [Hansschlegelia zhihuaiae]|nr:Mu transposase C-terminal domain-containing protein [Hansschlegelia zhihuaiae]